MQTALAVPTPRGEAPARWRSRYEHAVVQEPLLKTRPSLAALGEFNRPNAPQAVMVGIGLCSPEALTEAMPLDVLGLLLPAERLRLALGASTVLALVADTHAQLAEFDPRAVEYRARAAVATLLRVRNRFGLRSLCVVRASELHQTQSYRSWLRTVQARAGTHVSPYAVRQVTDVATLDDELGGLVKLGWVVGNDRSESQGDEAAFDRLVRPWSRRQPLFAYAPAGRTLCPVRTKAAPYVAVDPDVRITLSPKEQVHDKLAAGRCRQTANAVKSHLRGIANTYARTVEPLRGPTPDRVQSILDRLYRPWS